MRWPSGGVACFGFPLEGGEVTEADCVVVGGGVAGVSAALAAAHAGRVALLTKGEAHECNTVEAQGGVAAALGEDDRPEWHLEDTLAAGAGLCERAAVEVLVSEGPQRVRELLAAGAEFDREGDTLLLHREAAHRRRRILHAHGDATGREVQRVLTGLALRAAAVQVFEHTLACCLLMAEGHCVGVGALDLRLRRPLVFRAGSVVLATGAGGRLYWRTTNPSVATADGVALALQVGAEAMDLEMIQFHPTALHKPGAPAFLVTEALRGEGARLLNVHGDPFMRNYHPEGELAPRDVVCRAMVEEMNRTGADHVLLDLRPLGKERLQEEFPTVMAGCLANGLDPMEGPIPVSPAAHYMMGGVKTDLWGRTTVGGLYAAGECACTGVHGANRLASNSILEGLVFGHRAGQVAARECAKGGCEAGRFCLAPRQAEETMRRAMWRGAGVIRTEEGLREALHLLADVGPAPPGGITRGGVEAADLALVGQTICCLALARRESRGAHYRLDHPQTDRLAAHSIARLVEGGDLEVRFEPAGTGRKEAAAIA